MSEPEPDLYEALRLFFDEEDEDEPRIDPRQIGLYNDYHTIGAIERLRGPAKKRKPEDYE